MKKFLTIVFFCLPAFGQAAYSGSGLNSGSAAYSAVVSGGAPLAYSARTDNCVTGAESDCIGGRTTGQAGSAMSFLGRFTDTVPSGFGETTINSGSCPSGVTPLAFPAACVAPINSTASDPDFGANLLMMTDDYLAPIASNPWSVTWGVGDSGEALISQDETLVLSRGSGGVTVILNFNYTSFHAKTCASSPCVNKTGITSLGGPTHGDSTHIAFNSDVVASANPSDLYTFYEFDGLLVNKLVVTSSIASPGTGTMVRTVHADFENGTGSFGGVLPPITVGGNTSHYKPMWNGLNNLAGLGSTGTPVGGGYDWLPSWTPADVIGNTIFIMPLSTNPGNHGYQWTGAGGMTTGATQPVWNGAGCTSYAVGATCADGTGSWVDIGGVATQGPGFDIVQFSPALGYSRMNTRLGKIYRGSGNSAPAGLLTTDDPVACTRVLGAPCGAGVTVNLPDRYTMHNASQQKADAYFSITATGAESNNSPGNWNSGTLTCQNSGQTIVWAGAWSSGTTYINKQDVSYTDNAGSPATAYYVATTHASNLNQAPSTGGVVNTTYWTKSEAYCPFYIWTIATTIVQPTTAWGPISGHSSGGYLHSYHGGSMRAADNGHPSIQLSPPNGPITVNPGTPLLSGSLPADTHQSYHNADAGDHQPMFTSTADVPSHPVNYTAPCYDEVCAFANVVTGAAAATYRFAHNYGTGCNLFFPNREMIGTISPKGDFYVVGTDVMATRNIYGGSSNGGIAADNFCPAFASSTTTLSLNDHVYPSVGNAGNYVYQATVAGTTTGGAPNLDLGSGTGWCQTLNCTVSWTGAGRATVQAIGVNNGRGDMIAIDALSAYAAP